MNPLFFERVARQGAGPMNPLFDFFRGGPAPMEPTLPEYQQGAENEVGQTRRPSVLPITRDAQTGQVQFAQPKFMDFLLGSPATIGSRLAPVAAGAGEAVFGAGMAKTKGLPLDQAARLQRAKEAGYEGPWYHGSKRADRLTESGKLDPKRATSGPMPYFTDDPAMASNYAKGKEDTSLAATDEGNIADYFRVSTKDIGWGGRSTIPVERSWHSLPGEAKADILAKAKRVGYANPDEATGPLTLHDREASIAPGSHFDYLMQREHRGNPLAALRDIWHDSGTLIDDPSQLAEVFRLAGYPHKISDANAPWVEASGIFPAMLKMRNPLKTADAEGSLRVAEELQRAFKGDRTRLKPHGADMWAKDTRWTPRDWAAQMAEDAKAGRNSMVYTSVPDKVTAQLHRMGFDSILDQGGKTDGQGHTVAIPFRPDQVRSLFARFDPANEGSPFFMGAGIPLGGLGGLGGQRERR